MEELREGKSGEYSLTVYRQTGMSSGFDSLVESISGWNEEIQSSLKREKHARAVEQILMELR